MSPLPTIGVEFKLFYGERANSPAIRQAVFRHLGTIKHKAELTVPDQNAKKHYAKSMYHLSGLKKIDPQRFRNAQARLIRND